MTTQPWQTIITDDDKAARKEASRPSSHHAEDVLAAQEFLLKVQTVQQNL